MAETYSLDDMVAMATSRNVSYGRIQQCLEYGLKLPPLIRSTRWPKDSTHFGEDVLPGDVPEIEEQVAPKKRPSKKKFGSGVLVWQCDKCGEQILSNESVRIFIHEPGDAWAQGLKFADICADCANDILPRAERPKKSETESLYDADGRKVPIRLVGRCSHCGKLHHKGDGAQIYVAANGNRHPKIHSYLCMGCLPGWKRSIKA